MKFFKTIKRLFTVSLFASLLTLLGCSSSKKENVEDKTPFVVTTIGMIYDAVINIAQDKVNTTPLMGPGVDPHLYKATQGDLKKLQNADLVLYGGLHLEGKMGEVFEKLGRIKPVIAVSKDIPENLLRASEFYKNTYDPHVWFDIEIWKYAVNTVLTSLVKLDPTNKAFFEKNAKVYLDKMSQLHTKVKEQILEIPEQQRLIITAHDAFGYFGEAYGIEVKGLQGISTLSEPGLKDISGLVQLITNRKIKAVFIETSVSVKAINAVVEGCKQRGHTVNIGGSLYSDAMGEFDTNEGTYLGMFQANVNIIVNALK